LGRDERRRRPHRHDRDRPLEQLSRRSGDSGAVRTLSSARDNKLGSAASGGIMAAFSIVIPGYSTARYIGETIASVFARSNGD